MGNLDRLKDSAPYFGTAAAALAIALGFAHLTDQGADTNNADSFVPPDCSSLLDSTRNELQESFKPCNHNPNNTTR